MHLFLAFLHDGGKLDDPDLPAAEAANALGATLALLDRFVTDVGGQPSEHNMIITNGRVMLAARRGSTLSMMPIRGMADCALCRETQADFAREPRGIAHEHLRGIAFVDTEAEPEAPWEAVPDGTAVAVSHDLTFEIRPLGPR
jgi:hypothetical protein